MKVSISHVPYNSIYETIAICFGFGFLCLRLARADERLRLNFDNGSPMRSAMRDIGTATSVAHITVPSGLNAIATKAASFLADHRESISFLVVTPSKVLAL